MQRRSNTNPKIDLGFYKFGLVMSRRTKGQDKKVEWRSCKLEISKFTEFSRTKEEGDGCESC